MILWGWCSTPWWMFQDFIFPLLFTAAHFNLKDSGVAAEKLNDLSFTEDVSSDFKEISQLHHGKRDYREVVIETYSQGN